MMLPTVLLSLLLPTVFAAPAPLIPVTRSLNPRAESKPSSYIVHFKTNAVAKDNRANWLNNTLQRGDATVTDTESLKLGWDTQIFDGISGTFSADALNALRASADVDYIVEDTIMYTSALVTQTNGPWGLSRLSSTQALTNKNVNTLDHEYTFDDSGGQGVDIYVIDTGVRVTHTDFGGRATFGATFGPGVPGQDLNGHGSHVAGTAAGSVFGVAKQASIIAVKVMADDGSGATADIISGINFAAQSAAASGRPSVINMSLGGPANQAIDAAVENAVAQGVHVVVAAGNETQDTNNVSPGRAPNVITVGATTIDDEIASFSNFGSPVDVFAPGQDILSVGFQADNGVQNLSGTSMASPLVAGLGAYLLGLEGQMAPAQLRSRIIASSEGNVISGVPSGTANQFVFNDA